MAAADAEKNPKEEEEEERVGGEVLYFGSTAWDTMGRRPSNSFGNLISPTRLRTLVGVDIRFVASGSVSCHCVAVDTHGRCYTWGRNEKGQLGHGDTLQRNLPTVVSGLSKYKIAKAGSGRSHTVVVTDDGKSFAFGWNKHGQLGSGSVKNEAHLSPVSCLISQATDVACGGEFTMWLSSIEGSSILSAGLPQYGQLGHGTNREYNSKNSSVKLVYEPLPRPQAIAAFSEKTIVKVACGTNHTVAVDSSGFVYTWGYGGYGRLGHREQKDEWVPRLVDVFQRKNVLPPDAVVSAGSANSACTAGGGQLYMWGKIKNTGDDWMYPKPLMDLSGWNIHCMHSGHLHHVVGADDSCISWGAAQYGELGYGPHGQKSSSNPKKIESLDGIRIISVACGTGLSAVVVDRKSAGECLDQLDIYDGDSSVEGVLDDTNVNGMAKSSASPVKTPKNTNTKKRNKKEVPLPSSESESEDYGIKEEEDSEDDTYGNGCVKKANNKRGRGRPKGSSKTLTEVSGRGRGRPKGSSTSAVTTKVSGRSRGRPKSTETKLSGKGSRGRPKKSKS
ncbi:Protein RCC2 [Zostera marina]|uniref:Protein RCC2 n=1 Tax=Zostera marina TaxID=29655 RepID=A0A0K9NYD4_ZOSMR|nr:Protein RCC2 [Zostera marina]